MKGSLLWMAGLSVVFSWGVSLADEGVVARIGPTGEFVELSHQGDSRVAVERLPLHRAGNIRYFSAGIGIEERSAQYPPFPLKIIFTAGGKPFLSGVAVTIHPVTGETAMAIPKEQVEGPWLFVDLQPGVYDVTAVYRDSTQALKGIKVEAGKQKTIYLRWKEDLGLAGLLPAD